MTCNPFTSAAAKNSPTLLTPDNLNIQNFQDVINFDLNPVNRFNREKLNRGVKDLNSLLRRTDLSNLDVLNEKLQQAPINDVELAEFLENSATSADDLLRILDDENNRRKTLTGEDTRIRGTVSDFEVLNYPRNNPPGIFKKVKCSLQSGQKNIRGRCRGNVNDEGFFSGVIYEKDNSFNDDNEYQIVGSIVGIEGISGNGRIEGTAYNNNITAGAGANGGTFISDFRDDSLDTISISGTIKGTTFQPGQIIFDVELSVADDNTGSGASFNVVIGNNGQPLITVASSGSNYRENDIVILDDLNIELNITDTADLVTTLPTAQPFPDLPAFATLPQIPVSDFATSSFPSGINAAFFPAQSYVDLLNKLDNFLNSSYGSAISSGSCGSSFLAVLAGLFDLFGKISNFKLQLPSLQDIWDSAKEFVASIPSLLGALQKSFMKIVDNIINQARQTLENIKSSLRSVGASIATIGKEFANAVNFFSKENQTKIKNLVNSIMQNINDQFDKPPLEIITWILNRLCQLSDFISSFLNAPINAMASLITGNNIVKNSLRSISSENIFAATSAGAVRLPINQIRAQAQEAAARSSRAGLATSSPSSSTPPRITAFPISDEDLAAVTQNVTENGWPGIFTFSSSVINNNIDVNGRELKGAGWRVIVRDNPALFAKIKKIIDEVGQGPYIITSAFRSEEYNRRLRARGVNAALRSAHTEALALDIVMTSAQAINFVPVASANGFNGIAYYPNQRTPFLHVDLRTWRTSPESRSWPKGLPGLSGNLRNVIVNHQNNRYSR
jgi:hypothetical protein